MLQEEPSFTACFKPDFYQFYLVCPSPCDSEQSIPTTFLGASWFCKKLYYHPQVICVPSTRVYTYSVYGFLESHFISLISSDTLLWTSFQVHYILPKMKEKTAFKVWAQQVFTEQNNIVFCFVLHSLSHWYLTLDKPFWHPRSFTDSSEEVTLLKVTDKNSCCFALGNLSPHSLLSAPLWKGKPYSWINSLISTSPFLSMLLWALTDEQEHPQREFLQHHYSIPLQKGYFNKCPHADKFYFKSFPMGLCITQLTFESI